MNTNIFGNDDVNNPEEESKSYRSPIKNNKETIQYNTQSYGFWPSNKGSP